MKAALSHRDENEWRTNEGRITRPPDALSTIMSDLMSKQDAFERVQDSACAMMSVEIQENSELMIKDQTITVGHLMFVDMNIS